MTIHDFRSDTVTQPDHAMRELIAAAEVGDDVFGDDPSVLALESQAAELSGKEAALYVCSGTQSNLLALMSHCQRGEEYIVGQDAHTYLYEAGGGAVLGSIQPQPIAMEADGTLALEKIAAVIKPDDSHFAISRLICIENTHSGKVLPMDYMRAVQEFAGNHGLALHLDGARVANAAVYLGVDIETIARHVDTVSICLSKGLGAPVGSVLCGPTDFIGRARRWRKMLGGGMRQAGVLAAAGSHALAKNIQRLQHDHDNAAFLAQQLASIDGVNCDSDSVQTNILYFSLNDGRHQDLRDFLGERGIRIVSGKTIRLVTHKDVDRDSCEVLVTAVREFCS